MNAIWSKIKAWVKEYLHELGEFVARLRKMFGVVD